MAPNWATNVRPFAGLVHSRSHAEKKVDPLGELEPRGYVRCLEDPSVHGGNPVNSPVEVGS